MEKAHADSARSHCSAFFPSGALLFLWGCCTKGKEPIEWRTPHAWQEEVFSGTERLSQLGHGGGVRSGEALSGVPKIDTYGRLVAVLLVEMKDVRGPIQEL